jgi:hypothetical protein
MGNDRQKDIILLEVGSEVYFKNPDNNLQEGYYTITGIEEWGILILKNKRGEEIEAFKHEVI